MRPGIESYLLNKYGSLHNAFTYFVETHCASVDGVYTPTMDEFLDHIELTITHEGDKI